MLPFTFASAHPRVPRTTPVVVLCVVALHVLAIGALLLSPSTTTIDAPQSIAIEMVLASVSNSPSRVPPVASATQTVQKASTKTASTQPPSTSAVAAAAVSPSPSLAKASSSPPVTRNTEALPATAPIHSNDAPTGRSPPAPTGAPAFSLPSSEAHGLNNPAPTYPRQSRRLNEQGQVLIRVFVAADGSPQQGEVKTSSGFDRLDQEALRTVMRWRFVPGQRLGTPEAMWFNVPVNFVLE
ncbi:TonB Periplasmic protein TonB, links inner and outer membranes [Burkholderiaceae bacterium]